MIQNQTVQTKIEGGIAWVTIDNPPVNVTSAMVRAGLEKAISDVSGARVAILRCAGRTFVAGGDMSEFDAKPVLPHLPDIVQRIEDSPVPFIALMHGTVLGGGFEIAMACAWRIAAPGTRFGLPEVNIGIIPGAGGTQRLPRLIGMDAALDIACGGATIDAKTLLELGGLDLIAGPDLQHSALEFAGSLPERPAALSTRVVDPLPKDVLDQKKAAIIKRSKGQQSPLENFQAILWSTLPFAQGQPMERARHLELRAMDESKALRQAFFAERLVAKTAKTLGGTPTDINHIAIVGGGLMGAGIATAALNAGLQVTLIERDDTAAAAAEARVSNMLQSALDRSKISETQMSERRAAFHPCHNYANAATAQMAIEAVFEDVAVKKTVFAELAAVMNTDAILATNTSYLDPTLIFDGIPNPARCVGLHFFSPAHIMKLLEIVRLPTTSTDVLSSAFSLGKRLRKVSVLSGICDGFIGNRMLSAYRREADYLLDDGALPYQIDAAMRAFGMPMGPYELQDLTGLQIAWANRKRQAATRDPKERYFPIGDSLCEMDHFGQRTGQGWYTYSEGSRTPIRSEMVEQLITEHSQSMGISRQEFTAKDISSRLMAVLANEGALIVQEGIAQGDSDIDTVQIYGYGFPRWRGGPMHYAQSVGLLKTAEIMKSVANESPHSWKLAEF